MGKIVEGVENPFQALHTLITQQPLLSHLPGALSQTPVFETLSFSLPLSHGYGDFDTQLTPQPLLDSFDLTSSLSQSPCRSYLCFVLTTPQISQIQHLTVSLAIQIQVCILNSGPEPKPPSISRPPAALGLGCLVEVEKSG